MANIKCPICGEMYKGLNLDETDGWFICQKYKIEVMLPKYAKVCKVPLYTMDTIAEEYRRKAELV